MADDLFRVPSLSSKNSFQSNSLFNPAKQASNVLDDTSSKSQVASASKGYLPVFDLVPKYDDDIFQGVPGTKSATAGTVYDDLLGGVVNSTAAPHVVGRLSSGTNSTVRRPNSTDVSSGVNRDGLYEPNSSQPSRSRWGKPQTQYVRWSKPSSAGSDDFPHKPAKVKSRDDDHFVDPVSPEHRQEGTVLDSLDAFSMFHTGGRNIPTASKISNETSRTKGNTASIGSRQSTTVSSQSKPSHSSYLRQFESGNLNSSESTDKTGVLEGRTVSQHMHQSDPTTSRWSTPLSPSARNKSQHNTESRYGSPLKSNEFLADKLTPSKGFNVEQNAELIGHSKPRGFEEVWLAVDDVRLVTRPTLAPPPSRLPPPLGLNKNEFRARRKSSQIKGFDRNWLEDERRVSSAKVGSGSALGRQAAKTPASGSTLCPEKMSKVQLGSTNYILPEEQRVANVAAAPELDMKEAIKRAEALLKLGKELEEKELSAKAAKEAVQEGKENASSDVQRGGKNEHHHTDARQQKFDQERSWRHRDHERAKDNLAFESANLEAHGNAGGKTPPQTREKAEKAAVHRITAEVRERAAAAAREKVAAKIKTVTEARVKAAAEAREGATVHARDQSALESRERVALEARKKLAAEARERVAAEAREKVVEEVRRQEAAAIREGAAEEAREKEKSAAETIQREKEAGKARERERAETRERERERAETRERERAVAETREKERIAAEAREREKAAAEAREKEIAETRAKERTAREARERAAAEASEKELMEMREKAARELLEKLAVEAREEKVAEAKEKLIAVEKARMGAEAREKITVEAREREAARRAAAEARAISDRAAVKKAIDEVRERAAEKAKAEAWQRDAEKVMAEVRTRAATAQKDPMNASHPSKAFQKEDGSSVSGSSAMKSSPTIIPEDWMPSFVASPRNEFQQMGGELSDRRQTSSERHQRTEERMAKALLEKNQRDFEAQQQEAEKQRAAALLDAEICRWAVGKEGNLRALLSTVHYVLWPGCGWQPVSVSDLVTTEAVRKFYRKATLCVHPDKVQQKGCSIQQKYIAEKVFDLLKEAWNKFSSGELF